MGESWEEIIYSEDKLEETLHLLPVPDEKPIILPVESENIDDSIQYTDVKSEIDNLSHRFSTKSSSSTEIDSSSFMEPEKQTSIITNDYSTTEEDAMDSMELKSVKERHMSIDSARDSGIGDNSNFTDVEKFEMTDDMNDGNDVAEIESQNKLNKENNKKTTLWQSKNKRSLADRLPPNSFYLIPPSRYIFHGAEIFYDPNEKLTYFDDTSTSDSSDSDSDTENDNTHNSYRD